MSIRFDTIWFSTTNIDMRAGMDSLLGLVIRHFGSAQPYHAYVFTNRSRNRIKVLMHDDTGMWMAVRRLRQGQFVWEGSSAVARVSPQLWHELIRGSAWQKLPAATPIVHY